MCTDCYVNRSRPFWQHIIKSLISSREGCKYITNVTLYFVFLLYTLYGVNRTAAIVIYNKIISIRLLNDDMSEESLFFFPDASEGDQGCNCFGLRRRRVFLFFLHLKQIQPAHTRREENCLHCTHGEDCFKRTN